MDTAGAMVGARAAGMFGLVLVVKLFVSLLSIEAAEVSLGPGAARAGSGKV